MLNKEGQRELAYVVKVDDIQPIIGRDRVECAVVGGWTCMIQKGAFKPGDLGVYFEIDSKLDTSKPEFAFTEKYHGKIKTQKFALKDSDGNKVGAFFSQGLLMPFDELGLESLPEGTFLTKELGVTYAEPEDNKRKANIDKYKKMAQRHGDLFRKQPFKWLMRHNWGKKLLFIFFGKKRDNKSQFPYWVVKTDEERCLPSHTKILTEDGIIEIGKIVNKRLPVKVASMDTQGNIVYKKITNYQRRINDKDVITIKYPYREHSKRTNAICCTIDHRILTNRGYVEAQDLSLDDVLYMPFNCYNSDAIEALYGMLLGDSHIYNDKRSGGGLRIVATNGEKQLDYLKYKRSIFNNDGKIVNAGIGSFGKLPAYHWFLNIDAYITQSIIQDWEFIDRKILNQKVCEKITPISLAFWYMDDGCLSYHNNKKPWIRLNTQGFSYEENKLLVNMLKKNFNIESRITKDKIAKDGHQMYKIELTTEMSKLFLELVTPYMCDSMSYKTIDEYKYLIGTKKPLFTKKNRVLPINIISIEHGQKKNKTWGKEIKYVYDLEVEETHNFVADNIIVHNCQNLTHRIPEFQQEEWIATEKRDGTSTTMTLKREGKKLDYAVCSRNVRMENRKDGSWYDTNVYTEMADKYNIKKVLENLLTSEYDFVTIQGETFGEGIQKRDYGLKEHVFEVFNVIFGYKDGTTKRLNPIEMKELMDKYNVPTVPIIATRVKLPGACQEILDLAGGEAAIYGGMREGVVFRNYNATKSFKAVDNEFLAKYHN